MTESGSGTRRRIFISYRREETAYPAGWLFDRLKEHFGEGSVFKDLDSIEFGEDFSAAIAAAVGSCDVLLALIGQRWDTLTDERGRRRISKPDDWVRREIEAALTRNVRVIPILIDRPHMPHAADLPPSLAPLVHRQALEISPSRFTVDTTRLIAALEKTLDEKPRRPGATDPGAPTRRRRTGVAVAVAAAAVVVAALVIVVLNSAERVTGGSGAPLATAGAAPATAGAPPPAPTTAPPDALAHVVATDDFASKTNGWTVYTTSAANGRLVGGAYRMSVEPAPGGTAAGAFPQSAAAIYPVAPSNVVVEVTGTRLQASEAQMDYGIMCRANKDSGFGYFLVVSKQYAEIAKSSSDAEYRQLIRKPFPVEAGAAHRLRAECGSATGGEGVHLSLSVDGQPLAEYVDTTNPLTEGCVGLWIGMDETARTTGEAEFDDFIVRG